MRYVIDMLHHNPGEPPFTTRYADPKVLKKMGYTAQAFKHINCVATFEKIADDIFPEGSEERAWLTPFTKQLEDEIAKAKAEGLMVFYHIDLIVLPKRLIERFKDEICDEQGSIVFEREKTKEIHRALFAELTKRFPDIDGYIVRVGETYLYDTPYHDGNGAVSLKGTRESSKEELAREKDAFVSLITFLREEICVKHDRVLIHRTWDTHPDKFHSNAEYYLDVSNRIEPHENLVFSIKHSQIDFHRCIRFNDALGLGKHPQVIEVQCQREYEGKGAFPNYVMDGVINGFEEMAEPKGVKDVINNDRIVGFYTWSRGGGWYGPYITNELWIDLNVFVIAHYANDPAKTEEAHFTRFAKEWLHLSGADVKKFRRLCLLSARALLKGKCCTVCDVPKDGVSHNPTNGWMRDDRLGGLEDWRLTGVFDYLYKHDLFDEALAEKDEAVALYDEIVALADEIHVPDKKTKEYLKTSCEYGRFVIKIIRVAWHAFAMAYRKEKGSAYDEQTLATFLNEYDALWEEYLIFTKSHVDAASPYRPYYFGLPGDEPQPGMDATIARIRKVLATQ